MCQAVEGFKALVGLRTLSIFKNIYIELPHPPEKVPEREIPMSRRINPNNDGLD